MGGGGGKGGTSTSTVRIPKEVLARYNAVNKRAEALASRPFQEYTGQFVAGINPQQLAGMEGINNAANAGQGYFSEAGGLMRAGSGNATPGQLDINRYLSPYTENVVEATQRTQESQNRQQAQQLAGNAISQGAFGGDRAGIAQANLAGQQSLANQQTLAGLRQQGYTQALGAAQQQQGLGYQADAANLARRLQAGQGLAGLGAQAQSSALQGAQAQIAAGTLQQQTEQADLSAAYNQFLQKQGYDFQVAQFLANIAMGTGALSGSTTTNVQPTSFFSDERLKEDIKPIGKTFDGQPIYSYKMKGDPRTQIGLLAQEVEDRHPEAVGLARGYKTVDYDKATQSAAHRGHFYRGGLAASEGGGVSFSNAGEGFADGGVPMGGDIHQIVAAQKAMFPYQAAGLYGGQPGVGPHGVAMPAVDIGDLTRAFESRQGTPPAQQESGFKQALNTGEQIANTYDRGQKMYEGADRALYGSPASADNGNKPSAGLLGSGGGEGTEPGLVRQGYDAFTGLFSGKAHGGLVRPHYEMGGSLPYAQAQGSPLGDVLEEQKKDAPAAPKAAEPGAAGPSGFQQALQTGAQIASIASLFAGSDRRMKEGIEPIGKTFDGQTIHKYRYKNDPRTQIGLIAQEVERHHPDAVGLARGYKTVNYDTATKDAANRGHFGHGGIAGRHGYGTDGAVQPLPEWAQAAERIRRGEGTLGDKGYDTRYGGEKYAPPDKPLSQMTLGELSDYQRDKLIPATRGQIPGVPKTQGTGAAGAYQMTHGFINQYAPEFFGPNYRDETFFTPENQDALAEFVYNKYKNDPKKLAGTWATFSGLDPQGSGRALEIQQGRNPRNTTNPDGSVNVARNTVGAPAAGLDPRGPEVMGEMPPIMAERPAALAAAALGRPDAEAQKAGLAGPQGAQERPFGYPLRKKPDFMQRNQDWLLPLASGVGSMLASKSPFLLNAVGEGLVGAAEGYGTGQNRLSEMEERAANTENTFADIARNSIVQMGTGWGLMVYDKITGTYKPTPGFLILKNPENFPDVDPRTLDNLREKMKQSGQLDVTPSGGGSSASAAPAPARSAEDPAQPPTPRPDANNPYPLVSGDASALIKRNIETAQRAAASSSVLPPPEKDIFAPVESEYAAAQALKVPLNELTVTIANAPVGGPLTPMVTMFEMVGNQISEGLGLGPAFDPEVIANQELLKKQITRLSALAAEQGNQTAQSALTTLSAGLPQEKNTVQGRAEMMASILSANQLRLDKGRVFSQYKQLAQSIPGGEAYSPYAGTGLQQLYDAENSPATYAKEKEVLARMFMEHPPGHDGTWAEFLAKHSNDLTPEQRATVDKTFGTKDIVRYFSQEAQ